MVLVHELRIIHPYTVEVYAKGNQYGNLKTMEQLESSGQGMQLVSSSSYYDDVYGEGVFNVSCTQLGEGRLPSWTSKFISPSSLVLDDKTWIIFPFSRTLVTTPLLAKLKLETLTLSLNDKGTSENALNLPEDLLAVRTVEYLDIGAEKVDPSDYRDDRDPSLITSKLTGKGPLTPGWQEREEPLMCTYKVIIADFQYFGFQAKVEQLLVAMARKVTVLAHKTAFSTIDEWWPLTVEQIQDMRDERRRSQGSKIMEFRSPRADLASQSGSESGSERDLDFTSSDEDEEADVFLDAETELAMEQQERGAQMLAGLHPSMLEASPRTCPFCMAYQNDAPNAPAVYCSTCSEFSCSACFGKVHATQKMKQHKTAPVEPEALRTGGLFHSASVAGPLALGIPESTSLRREASRAGGRGDSFLETARAALTPSVAPLTWDKVKDPPLNIFSARGQAPGPDNGEKESRWMAVLRGSAGEEEDSLFVEVPPELTKQPAELAAAMVSILSALYRSRAPSNGEDPLSSTPCSFPLGNLMADADSLAQLFPSLAISPPAPGSCSQATPDSPHGANCYGVPAASADVGQYEAAVEVKVLPLPSWASQLEQQRLQAARLYRSLAEELLEVDPQEMRGTGGGDSALAFWINVHNALLLHGYLVFGIPKTPKDLSMLLEKAAYLVGGVRFSAAGIAQTVLRPGELGKRQLGLVSGLPFVGRLMTSSALLSTASVPKFDPLAVFALSLGTFSCPLVRPVHAKGLQGQLAEAARGFLGATVTVEGGKVHVPMLFYSHRSDFGNRMQQLEFLQKNVSGNVAAEIQDCAKKLSRNLSGALSNGGTKGLLNMNLAITKVQNAIPQAASRSKVRIYEPRRDDVCFRYLFPLNGRLLGN